MLIAKILTSIEEFYACSTHLSAYQRAVVDCCYETNANTFSEKVHNNCVMYRVMAELCWNNIQITYCVEWLALEFLIKIFNLSRFWNNNAYNGKTVLDKIKFVNLNLAL